LVVDHRAYLGGVAVLLFLAWHVWRPGRLVPAALLVALFAGRSLHYQWILASPLRTWESAVERAPHSVAAHRALADARAAEGDAVGAERELRHALRLDPRDVRSAVNLGVLFVEQRRYEEAARAFQAASRLAPSDARIRDNLGMLLAALGRVEPARLEFEAAIRGEPALAQPRINLARLLMASGDPARAARLLDEAAGLVIDEQEARLIEELRAALP
jgi:Flp pilus assembly protein TadD